MGLPRRRARGRPVGADAICVEDEVWKSRRASLPRTYHPEALAELLSVYQEESHRMANCELRLGPTVPGSTRSGSTSSRTRTGLLPDGLGTLALLERR